MRQVLNYELLPKLPKLTHPTSSNIRQKKLIYDPKNYRYNHHLPRHEPKRLAVATNPSQLWEMGQHSNARQPPRTRLFTHVSIRLSPTAQTAVMARQNTLLQASKPR